MPAGTLTSTLIVQVPLAAIVPFAKTKDGAPAAIVQTGVPQPEVEYVNGVATTIAPGEVGNVSAKFKLLSATPFGLESVNVRLEVPPAVVEFGVKALVIVTALGETIAAIRALVDKSAL